MTKIFNQENDSIHIITEGNTHLAILLEAVISTYATVVVTNINNMVKIITFVCFKNDNYNENALLKQLELIIKNTKKDDTKNTRY